MRPPDQPLEVTDGVIRFRANEIVRYLLAQCEKHGIGMNELAVIPFRREDRVQFAQLIGYSVSGYGELPYVADPDYARADRAASRLRPRISRKVSVRKR